MGDGNMNIQTVLLLFAFNALGGGCSPTHNKSIEHLQALLNQMKLFSVDKDHNTPSSQDGSVNKAQSLILRDTQPSNMRICDEKNFYATYSENNGEVTFQVADDDRFENRMYKWSPWTNRVVETIYTSISMQQLYAFSFVYIPDFKDGVGLNVRIGADRTADGQVLVCVTWGQDHLAVFSESDPFPLDPLCGCSWMDTYSAVLLTVQNVSIMYSDDANFQKHFNQCSAAHWSFTNPPESKKAEQNIALFPFIYIPNLDFINVRGFYYHEANRVLYTFKRRMERKLVVQEAPYLAESKFGEQPGAYIQYEIVGIFSFTDRLSDQVNETKTFLMEQLTDSETNFTQQYLWLIEINNQTNLFDFKRRYTVREFFGCGTTNERMTIGSFLGLCCFLLACSAMIGKCCQL